jgi:RNA polymerase sigma-70 factor (ECF subfamily)
VERGTDGTTGEHGALIDAVWREQRLFAVDLAFKMLGNFSDAEDVVQDAFSRLLNTDLTAIEDVRGWLVVVVSRLCLDDLRSARSRRVDLSDDWDSVQVSPVRDPADRVTLDDSIRMALVIVLQQLSPAERAVFVLHDVFGFEFDTVGSIVGRSSEACRKLATRARRRMEADASAARFLVRPVDEHRVVERFVAACAGGDLSALMELLDPDVVGEVDLGPDDSRPLQVGRDRVGLNLLRFFGGTRGVTLVPHPINGDLGALAFRDRQLVGLLTLQTRDSRIVDIHAIVDPSKLALASLQFGSRE